MVREWCREWFREWFPQWVREWARNRVNRKKTPRLCEGVKAIRAHAIPSHRLLLHSIIRATATSKIKPSLAIWHSSTLHHTRSLPARRYQNRIDFVGVVAQWLSAGATEDQREGKEEREQDHPEQREAVH
jgi:hypothetical protein